MKLGLSQACYRWVIYPNMRRDRPEYLSLGRPLPYLQTIEAPTGDDTVDWLIAKMLDLGLVSLFMDAGWIGDRTSANAFADRMQAHGLEYLGNVTCNIAADADEWRAAEFNGAVEQIRSSAAAGASLAAAKHNRAYLHNHFTKDPPVAVQIERAARNFRSLIPVCEEHGLVLAFENHLDYRISDIVQIVAAVDSPWLRINFDTANPFGVVEDPLDAARAAAKYTVMAHLKDLRIQPATGTGEPRVYWAPLGRGDVPIAEILALLQAESPDPAELSACLEVAPPPEHDPDVWVRDSLDWLRATCGQYFNDR